jgi:hypothetical protein
MRRPYRATVALLVVLSVLWPGASIGAADSHQGKWKGKTGQSKRVIVKVNAENEVTRFFADLVAFGTGYCHQGLDYTLSAKGLSVPIKDDAFDFKVEDGPVTGKISGHFSRSGKKVAGRLKASIYSVESGIIICDADENFRWNAHKL